MTEAEIMEMIVELTGDAFQMGKCHFHAGLSNDPATCAALVPILRKARALGKGVDTEMGNAFKSGFASAKNKKNKT